jgi:alcohol dehydrogenase, propanol-preferring
MASIEESAAINARTSSGSLFDIPLYCKAGVVHNLGPDFEVRVENVRVPEPGKCALHGSPVGPYPTIILPSTEPDQVLIRLKCTGVCQSDIHYMSSAFGPGVPTMDQLGTRSPGHEGAGVIVKTGAHVKGWKIGDRVGVKPMWDTCGRCECCWSSTWETHCGAVVHTGLMVPGTYQQYITHPARYLTAIPDGVSDYVAGPAMCSAATMYRALAQSGLKAGQWAAIPGGGGGVGTQGVQLAKAMGFRVIAIDSGEDKKALAMEMGAEAFVDFKETEDIVRDVVKIADEVGCHGVFVASPQAYDYAVHLTGKRVGAVVTCIAVPAGDDSITVGTQPLKYIMQGLQIVSSIFVHDMESRYFALIRRYIERLVDWFTA